MSKRIRSASDLEILVLLVMAGSLPALGCGDDDSGGGGPKRDAGPSAGRGSEDEDAGKPPTKPVAGRGGSSDDDTMDGGVTETDAGDDDGGVEESAPGFRDLSIQMTGMATAVDYAINFALVSGDDLVAVAMLDPLPEADYTFTIPDSVPAGSHELHFFADIDGMEGETVGDETWAVDVPSSGNPAVVEFDYAVGNDAIGANASGSDLRFMSTGLAATYEGDLIEIRLTEVESGQLVGLYRGVVYAGGEFARTFSGVIHDDVEYRIDIWVDADEDGAYDALPTDHSWRKTYTGTAANAVYAFTVDDDYTAVDF
jgi:hypothetical protein